MTDQLPAKAEKIRCDACPVMCFIADGKSGACDRYANHSGELVRLDPLTIIQGTDQKLVSFMKGGDDQESKGSAKYGPLIAGIFSHIYQADI